MKKYIAVFLLMVLASCGSEPTTTIQPCESDSLTVVDEEAAFEESVDSLKIDCDSLFCAELSANMKKMTDDQRVSQLASSSFWTSADTLTRQQYILLFNYLIDHQNEKFDDQIGDFIFEHFQSKAHFEDFDTYYKQYSDPCILEALTFSIISSWKNESESITEKDFKSKFRYLYNNGCVKYFRMLESLEK